MPKNVSKLVPNDATGSQAFASTFTPDISLVSTVTVTLTGAITDLNAPTGRTYGRFTLVFTQDATGGRALTWDTTDYPDFAVTSWQPNFAASSVSSITFIYDGSKWRVLSTFGGDVWAFKGGTSSSNILYIGDQGLQRTATGTISTTDSFRVANALTVVGYASGIDPTSPTHLATKNYVDTNAGMFGTYQIDSSETVTVPAKRMFTIHTVTAIDGTFIVDGRVGSL